MNRIVILVLSCFVMVFVGCSTYHKKQCQNFDWYKMGLDEALEGRTSAGSMPHFRRECGREHGVRPDEQKYQQGFVEGQKAFCTPARAYAFGKSGGNYGGQCEGADEELFLKRYQLGKIDYTSNKMANLESKVSSMSYEMESLRSNLRIKDQEIESLKSQLHHRHQ